MHRLPIGLLSILAVSLAACGDDSPEVSQATVTAAVRVAMPQQGSLPRLAVAYGDVGAGNHVQESVDLGVEGKLVSLNVLPGAVVHRGQVLGAFRPSPAAWAGWSQARSAVDVATRSLERVRRLRADDLATDEQVAQAVKAEADATSTLAAFPVKPGRDGTLPVLASDDGTVATLGVTPGQTVTANTTLLSIAPREGQRLLAGVEPSLGDDVKPGMEATLTPIDGGDTVAGHVDQVAGAIDPATRTVPVQVRPDRALMPGSAWRADIVLGEVRGWIAPADALVEDDQGHWLYQVSHGRAHRVKVEVLLERGGRVVLGGDVDSGAAMIVEGAPQLSEGMNVSVTDEAR